MYVALIRIAIQRQLAYRAANWAGLATNLFFGFLRASVLVALYNTRDQVAGYTVQGAVTYTGITQALLSYIAIWGWWDLIRSIRTGEVAADLSRPLDYVLFWAAQDLGRASGQFALRSLPLLALYALLYHLALPPTPFHWLALIPVVFLAWWVSFLWRFVVSLSAFWTPDAMGIGRAASTLATFLSGFMMPIAFFPSWLSNLIRLTPFPAMITVPVEVFLGIVPVEGLLPMMLEQCAWGLAMYLLARLVLSRGVSKLVIQGG